MNVDITFFWMSLIMVFAYMTQAITGFGAIIISVTISSFFFSISALTPILVPLTLFVTIYLAMRSFQKIEWRFIVYKVLPFIASGMLLGFLITKYYTQLNLKLPFSMLVVFISIVEIIKLISKKIISLTKFLEKIPSYVWVIISGIIHGLYASGGPFLVYGLSKVKFDKAVFRATLSAIWCFLNFTLTVMYLMNGNINKEVGSKILFFIPTVLLGTFLGNVLHNRISEKKFSLLVFTTLFFSGMVLLIREIK